MRQVIRQIIAEANPRSRQILEDIVIQMTKESADVKEKFAEQNIKEIDIGGVLSKILSKPPVVGMPIGRISQDLKEWAWTLRNDVRLWLVRKFIECGPPRI